MSARSLSGALRPLSRSLQASCSRSSTLLRASHRALTCPKQLPAGTIRSPSPYLCRRSYAATPFPTAKKSSFFRPLNILVVLVPFVTFGLGVWQIKRLRWKVALIDDIQRNIEKDPLILPPRINLNALPDFAFRRVLIKGEFEGPPVLFGPAVVQGTPGSNLILPFSRASTGGSTILVNRGFITSTRAKAIRDGTERAPGVGEGEVVIEGMLSKNMDGGQGRWTPDNRPETNEWFWKDMAGMSDWVSGEGRSVDPVLVDVVDNGREPLTFLMHQGVPVGRPPTVEIRNQHATYSVIWFSLSAVTAAMTFYLVRNRRIMPKANYLRRL